MRNRCFGSAATGVLLLALLAGPPVHATTVVQLELDQMVDLADGIFTGTVIHSAVVLSEKDRFPFTFVTFELDSALKGTFPGRQVTLRLHGGEIGEESVLVVHGMPHFEVGESYLVFVEGNGTSGCPVLGWSQGHFRFTDEALSGERILVDWRGAPLLGIADGRLQKGRPQGEAPPAGPQAVLLGVEGVEIEEVPGAPVARPDEIPRASSFVQELQAYVHARSRKPSFVPGRQIPSADPANVPAQVGGALTSPELPR